MNIMKHFDLIGVMLYEDITATILLFIRGDEISILDNTYICSLIGLNIPYDKTLRSHSYTIDEFFEFYSIQNICNEIVALPTLTTYECV